MFGLETCTYVAEKLLLQLIVDPVEFAYIYFLLVHIFI